jgi:hypothetical protein
MSDSLRRRGGRGSPGRDFVVCAYKRGVERHQIDPIHMPEKSSRAGDADPAPHSAIAQGMAGVLKAA